MSSVVEQPRAPARSSVTSAEFEAAADRRPAGPAWLDGASARRDGNGSPPWDSRRPATRNGGSRTSAPIARPPVRPRGRSDRRRCRDLPTTSSATRWRPSSSSSTGASRVLSRRSARRRGRRGGTSCGSSRRRADAVESLAGRRQSRIAAFTALNTAFERRRARHRADERRASRSRSTSCSSRRAATQPTVSYPRVLDRRGRAQPGAGRRDATSARRRRALHQRRDGSRRWAQLAARALRGAARAAGRRTTLPAAAAGRARGDVFCRTPSRSAARSCETISRGARRRGRRLHAERAVPGRRRHARRQPHDDRSRPAALRQPRGLQGHPRRPGRAASSTARSSSGRTRRRPTRSRPTRRCCCRPARRSTPSRSSRSSPTT